MGGKAKTEDGLEFTMGVNHFGHFLLTILLLPIIKRNQPSRIINVSSLAYRYGCINTDDINCEKSYNMATVYADSKLANVLFTRKLAQKLQESKVTVNSLHPGIVNTDLSRHIAEMNSLTRIFDRFIQTPFKRFFFRDITSGAQTTIYAGKFSTVQFQYNLNQNLTFIQLWTLRYQMSLGNFSREFFQSSYFAKIFILNQLEPTNYFYDLCLTF